MLLFVFLNQKTAYEMRISDWSSDVCSSDLTGSVATPPGCRGCVRPVRARKRCTPPTAPAAARRSPQPQAAACRVAIQESGSGSSGCAKTDRSLPVPGCPCRRRQGETGRASRRERVGQYVKVTGVEVSL